MESRAEQQPTPGRPIPASPDFPVEWDVADDANLYWEMDLMHTPDPMTTLEFDFAALTYLHGINHAAAAYELPIRFRGRRVNGYVYQSVIPADTRTGRHVEKISAVMARLGDYWEEELLPEIKGHLAYFEDFDLRGATMRELLSHLDETEDRAKRLGELHYLIAFPTTLAASMFDDLYRELFGDENALAAYKLLWGFDNKTLEADRELWKLSREALAVPEVRKVLEERATADVILELERTGEGRAFLSDLRAHLDEYGQRGDKFSVVGDVSWIEDPTPVVRNLEDSITQPDRNPEAELAALAAEREWLASKARERLKNHPRTIIDRFESLLKAAQEATVMREDHAFWIDYRGFYQIRRVLREFGLRFSEAGVIEEQNDVLHLALCELRETAGAVPDLDRRRLARERKAGMDHFRDIQPPRAIGAMPRGKPPDDPMGRAIGKYFGGAPKPQGNPNVLRGNAGSPGTARGPAKVIRSLAEASKLQKGDVLVAGTTAPPWTPLFATAAAIVTDTGGVLSHCAVVAREYQIPAVVGTGTATDQIQDGQLLEVDGDAGIVRVVR